MNRQQPTPEELAAEVRRMAAQLQVMGRSDLLLHALGVPVVEQLRLEAARERLLPLHIDADWHFYVGRHEVELQPVQKAVYLLFLAHPEGIEFKRLADYRQELTRYYMLTTHLLDKGKIEDSVAHLVNPLDNAINEKCSRIKSAFLALMDEYAASYYIISGHTSKRIGPQGRIWYERLKIVTLPRHLVCISNPHLHF